MYRDLGKRILDIIISTLAVTLTLPITLITAAAIFIEDGSPVFFKQKRVGKDGKEFVLIKFRSMKTYAKNLPSSMAKDMPLTRVGKIIRRLNIDELPQLINVIKGEMSIVGPRPSLPSQIKLNEMRRENGSISCKPGMTGLAQINAYDGMPEEEKARYDGEYYENLSFFLDIKIILRTFLYFLKPPPVY